MKSERNLQILTVSHGFLPISKRKMVINVPSSFQLFMVCTGRTTAAACSQKKNANARLHLNLFDFAFL